MRITMRQLEDYVRQGRIPQSELDRVVESQTASRKKLQQMEDAAVEETRVTLTAPIIFTVPMELYTENRLRAMNPLYRGRHIKAQRAIVCNAWSLTFRHRTPALPVVVAMTRYGRHMDGHDSLAAAFKHVTDEVTRLLGLRNDDTEEVTWKYRQEPRGSEAMKITIQISPCS